MTPIRYGVFPGNGESATGLSPSSLSRRLALDVVSPGDAMGFIVPTPAPWAPAFEGRWDIDYVCGRCGRVVCQGVKRWLFAGIVFRCVACNALNRVPGAPSRLSAFE